MYRHLQDLQNANEKSIEKHLQAKTQAYKLKQMLVENLIVPMSTDVAEKDGGRNFADNNNLQN